MINYNDSVHVILEKVAQKDLLVGDYVKMLSSSGKLSVDPLGEMRVERIDINILDNNKSTIHFAYPYWVDEFEVPGISFAHFETSFYSVALANNHIFYQVKRVVRVPNYFRLRARYPELTFQDMKDLQSKIDNG